MQGLELKVPVKPVINELFEDGVIVVSAGANVIRMLPPFIVEKEHIDEFIKKLEKSLKNLK